MSDIQDILSALGVLRYGVPTEQKERIALSRSLPGAPPADTQDAQEAQRYAAGFLHEQTWPRASEATIPAVALLRGLFGESPELMSYAHYGANVAKLTPQDRRPSAFTRPGMVK